MSNLVAHAKRELELAGWFDETENPDSIDLMAKKIGEATLELVELFASQGHSGMSAQQVITLLKELLQFRTLSKNDHSLYVDRTSISFSEEEIAAGNTLWQCVRDPRFFSKDQGKTWYSIDYVDGAFTDE